MRSGGGRRRGARWPLQGVAPRRPPPPLRKRFCRCPAALLHPNRVGPAPAHPPHPPAPPCSISRMPADFPLGGVQKMIFPLLLFFLWPPKQPLPFGNGTSSLTRLEAEGEGEGKTGMALPPGYPAGPRPPSRRLAASSPGASRKEEGGENGFHFRLAAGTTSPQNILE